MDLVLWIIAVILVVAGILALFRRQILWGIVLIAIGLQASARATKGQAWATAIGVWAIGLILPLFALLRAA